MRCFAELGTDAWSQAGFHHEPLKTSVNTQDQEGSEVCPSIIWICVKQLESLRTVKLAKRIGYLSRREDLYCAVIIAATHFCKLC